MAANAYSELFLQHAALEREHALLRVKLLAYEPWTGVQVDSGLKERFMRKHNNTKITRTESLNARKAKLTSLTTAMGALESTLKTAMTQLAQKSVGAYKSLLAHATALQELIQIDTAADEALHEAKSELWNTKAALKQQEEFAKIRCQVKTLQAKGVLNPAFALPSIEHVMASPPSSAPSSPLLGSSSSAPPSPPTARLTPPPMERAPSPLAASTDVKRESPSSSACKTEASSSSLSAPPSPPMPPLDAGSDVGSSSPSSDEAAPMAMTERKRKRKKLRQEVYTEDEAMESSPAEIAAEQEEEARQAKLDEAGCASESTEETGAMDFSQALKALQAAMVAAQSC